MGTIVVLAVVLLIVFFCIKDIVKSHKSGGSCSSCSSKGSCSGSCSDCGGDGEILVTVKRRKE